MIESPSTNEHIIRKVPGSNPGLKTVYSDCQSSWFPSQPRGPYQKSIQSAHPETLITTWNENNTVAGAYEDSEENAFVVRVEN